MITDEQLQDYATDPRTRLGKMASELLRMRKVEAVLIEANIEISRICCESPLESIHSECDIVRKKSFNAAISLVHAAVEGVAK
jgi:hypothetical protein